MRDLVYIDGRILPPSDASVPLDDRGFLYGDGLFETVRVYHSVPFRIGRHLERMAASARELGIPLPRGDLAQAAASAARELIDDAGLSSGVLRIELTRGRGAGPNPPPLESPSSLVVLASEGRLYPPELYRRGLRAVTAPFPRNERSPIVRHKTLNYLECILARRGALAAGCDEAVFLNTAGRLAEAAASNLFIVRRGRLVTPPPSEGLLPGVARAEVLDIARAEGIGVEERPVEAAELASAEEAFLTNSVLEVCPLVELDGRRIGRPAAAGTEEEMAGGELTRLLARRYSERAESASW